MAEEITKVIENVDELFPEIVVNGESHVSERYVAPPQADVPASTSQTQEEEPTQPQQTVQGEYVDTLSLNGVEHDLKDSPLSAEVSALQTLLDTIQTRLNGLSALIPSQASAQNQLADKNFVNSSIATNTANFLGTYTSLADIEAIQNPTNNDYAFLETADTAGNNVYDRYKYSAEDGEWLFEYELNNSSFTAEQWATINSGISQVSDTVQDGDTNPVSSDAVYEALQNAVSPVDVVQSGNMRAVTSNAVAEEVSKLVPSATLTNVDLDTANAFGMYRCNYNVSHPDTQYHYPVANFGVLIVVNANGDVGQYFIPDVQGSVYKRYLSSGTWTSWVRFVSYDDLASSVQSGNNNPVTSNAVAGILGGIHFIGRITSSQSSRTYYKINNFLSYSVMTGGVFLLQSRGGELCLLSAGRSDTATVPIVKRLLNNHTKIIGFTYSGTTLYICLEQWANFLAITQIGGDERKDVTISTATQSEYNSGTAITIET